MLVLALALVVVDVRAENSPASDAAPATYPFTFDTLLADAKRRATTPYAPQRNRLPVGLDKLSPEQYRSIRFNPDAGIWRNEKLPFRLELLRAGSTVQTVVTVSTVEDGMAQDVTATPAMFQMQSTLTAQLSKVSLPLSGFRIRSRINSNKVWDEFLVFQGASYFRAVGKGLLYGASARGLAINTAEPSGEEFPAFTHFWIERPGPHANAIVIYALLESESATGAYRFTVQPGVETLMDVDFTLFPRTEVHVAGIAPLTSMFLFDETNRGRLDDYRPEVHDSDGLQIESQAGEHIFRQLANPLKLQVSTFTTQQPHGFGLVQRSRQQSDFQDFEAQYERRPSGWRRFCPWTGAAAVPRTRRSGRRNAPDVPRSGVAQYAKMPRHCRWSRAPTESRPARRSRRPNRPEVQPTRSAAAHTAPRNPESRSAAGTAAPGRNRAAAAS